MLIESWREALGFGRPNRTLVCRRHLSDWAGRSSYLQKRISLGGYFQGLFVTEHLSDLRLAYIPTVPAYFSYWHKADIRGTATFCPLSDNSGHSSPSSAQQNLFLTVFLA